eukprot:CAMPEP_0196234600 /NCGR_PEP_ID=MMETSP0913-20130531/4655_1 /TAXON_ID=49265 /ORGANISM="Thalassiosira rotula, Strain GSO102" /LENGTH=97 /DNA_ID=CAMNT_0041515709 /DNA_START=281 /DNA_END=574 /DNA_ORIENTATION=-
MVLLRISSKGGESRSSHVDDDVLPEPLFPSDSEPPDEDDEESRSTSNEPMERELSPAHEVDDDDDVPPKPILFSDSEPLDEDDEESRCTNNIPMEGE